MDQGNSKRVERAQMRENRRLREACNGKYCHFEIEEGNGLNVF